MKNKHFVLSSLILFSTQAFGAISLKSSFEAAKLNMESIKRADAVMLQSEELKTQARSSVLPSLNVVGSYTKIDRPDAAGTSPFLLTKQHSASLRLSQPIIRGGAVAAYDLAKDNILLAHFQKDATELNLYQLIINAYYNLQMAQIDKKNVEELLKYSRERVAEIRGRTKIGRSRKGELIEAQAQMSIAESQLQQSIIGLSQNERIYEFYTGLPAEEIGPLANIPNLDGSVSNYIMKVKSRPDISAARQESKMADRRVTIAKGGHYPSVDVVGNYYLSRTGVLETSDWDVGVAVVIPIFQGGSINASVKEAAQEKRIVELRSSELQRAAERDITINYQNVVQLQLQVKSLKNALEQSQEAYSLILKDYKFGLVTNLDVLQTLNVYIETKRNYNNAIALTHLNYKNLEAATGVLP